MSLTKVTYSMIAGAVINVLDKGAVGDGVANDSPAFQAAYDELIASGNGGTIFAPATTGGYRLQTALNFTSSQIPITLMGEGTTNIPDNRPNDSTFGTVLWGDTGDVVIDISARANFGLENLTIDTNHTTKCPTPARIGVLGGRVSAFSGNQNHHFTNVAIFMKSTGSATSPSIAHYAYGTELGAYINCWYFADVPAVYNLAPLYNVTSPYVTLAATGTSATCNTMTGCRYVAVSGLGPAVHIDGTYDNSFVSSYFYNEAGSATTHPAIKLTGYNHALKVDTFQCEEFDICVEVKDALFSSKITGFTTSTFFNNTKSIGIFNATLFCIDNVFEIETGGIGYSYAAYAGTLVPNSIFVNNTFQLNQTGEFNLTAGASNTIDNLIFTKWTNDAIINIANYSSFVNCRLNNSQFLTNSLNTSKVLAVVKSGMPNNTANYIFSVTVPNKDIAGTYLFDYVLNSSSNELIKSGQIHLTVARVENSATVLSVSESIAQQSAQAAGSETIAVTFSWSGVFDPVTGTQYAFMRCTQNSSTGGTAYIRGTVTGFSSLLDNTSTSVDQIVLGIV